MSTGDTNRTKFAVGHFLTERPDDPKSFLELARRYAPRLREVYFAWPGLLNGRAHLHKRENEAERIISDLKYCREHGMKLDLLANATCYGERRSRRNSASSSPASSNASLSFNDNFSLPAPQKKFSDQIKLTPGFE